MNSIPSRLVVAAALVFAANPPAHCADGRKGGASRGEFLETQTKAGQGDARAQYNLGYCYLKGQDVGKDYVEAEKWFRKSAEQNFAEAQNRLGHCYFDGQGVKKDHAEAAKWYRKAAEQNIAVAQSRLGLCYKNGQGVKQDYVEAYAWISLAGAQVAKAPDSRVALEKQMSPQQIAGGQKRAKELRAQIEARLHGGGK